MMGCSKAFAHIILILHLSNYTYRGRVNHHIARVSKWRFIHLYLNYAQHSNTPVPQHSNNKLSGQPILSELAQIARFSILE